MNGVQGPYAKRVLVQELGGSAANLIGAEPREVRAEAWSPRMLGWISLSAIL